MSLEDVESALETAQAKATLILERQISQSTASPSAKRDMPSITPDTAASHNISRSIPGDDLVTEYVLHSLDMMGSIARTARCSRKIHPYAKDMHRPLSRERLHWVRCSFDICRKALNVCRFGKELVESIMQDTALSHAERTAALQRARETLEATLRAKGIFRLDVSPAPFSSCCS